MVLDGSRMTLLEQNASERDRRTSTREDVEALAREVRALRWRLRVWAVVLVSVFAGLLLAGGAWAASRYLITSTTQIKPSVLAKIEKSAGAAAHGSRGVTGAIGPAGSAGASGAAGLPGPQGPAGTAGMTGETGSTGATGAANPDDLAEQLAITAQTAALTYGAGNADSFVGLTPAVLVSINPAIQIVPGLRNAFVSVAIGTLTGNTVTATAPDGNTFSITDAHGTVVHTCTNAYGQTACVNGTW